MRRTFTVEEANRTLPYVRRVVEDIVRTYERWQERVREFEVVVAASPANRDRTEALQEDVQGLAADIDRFSEELERVGARIEEYEGGCVVFPAVVDGRDASLHWRLGEPTVRLRRDGDADHHPDAERRRRAG